MSQNDSNITEISAIRDDLLNVQGLTIELSNDIEELKHTVKNQGNTIARLELELKKSNDFKAAWLNDALAKIENSDRKNKAMDRKIAALEARFLVFGQPFSSSESDQDD
jgi:predicted  nucleic acid-binding Zn-ribbon protein